MKYLLIALGALVAVVLGVQGWFFVQVGWWVNHDPQTTAFMRARLAELRGKDPKAVLRQTWVAYGRISPDLKPVEIAVSHASVPLQAKQYCAETDLELAASALMAKVAAETQKQSGGKVQAVSMSEMRTKRKKRLTVVKEAK